MNLKVEIEKNSGFCGGVIRAIGTAERFLDSHPGQELHSLGAIVHNEAELSRLGAKGLATIDKEELIRLQQGPGRIDTLLIRAHGEPPETYSLAKDLGIGLIDCTCPVVLRLQKSIREAYDRLRDSGGRIVIFGKVGHAEVLGLLGQVGGDAVVVENSDMLEARLSEGSIDTSRPVEVFSQTTKSPIGYSQICYILRAKMTAELKVHDTICLQVASRHSDLAAFASGHDAIVFVADGASSNGKVLCDLCRTRNPRTWRIASVSEIDASWFEECDSVGICGATSTPRWLMEEVAQAIGSL